ncbi:MAG: hypothetical protein M1826_002159 [Phylliscum demangeonii]|nr:MAG: hypothetical protein M1826_002159 [Phylliscum demangeonii]
MGASAKRKKEKKKDFQKTKLKVGKIKPKASNFTDTSFQARALVLKQQSLRTSAPSLDAQLTHHVSLLGAHSDSQCRESLAWLTSALGGASKPLQPWTTIIPKLLPLITRTSASLRSQLLKLFRVIPPEEVRAQIELFVIFLRTGMTSLSADVRLDTFEMLGWLLNTAGTDVVACPGGWAKLLKCFVAVFAWDQRSISSSLAVNRTTVVGDIDKARARQLQIFGQFLQHGLAIHGPANLPRSGGRFPLWHAPHHDFPQRPNCYGYLNLFGPVRDEDAGGCEDRQDRQRLFAGYKEMVDQGLAIAKRQGGEIGRVAAFVTKEIDCIMNEI